LSIRKTRCKRHAEQDSKLIRPSLLSYLMLLASLYANAQQNPPAIVPDSTTVIVFGNAAAVSQGESARSVVVTDTQQNRLAYQDLEDYLRADASVDIQQRAPAGVMADISVRGASFEQSLILLNGMRMNDAETSHFNLDLPLPLAALGSIDVLHGAGSTLYGSDAIGGVVDFVTWEPAWGRDRSALRLRTGVGSFGENQQSFLGTLVEKRYSEVAAGGHDLSTGFIADRDDRTESASSETRLSTRLGSTDLLLAGDDRSFGAAQFYGNYNSWERTKGWFAALIQQFDPGSESRTEAAFGYRRHSDIFLLERDQPAGQKNQHVDDGFEGSLRDRRPIFSNVTLLSGLEETTDHIESTNLGEHGRNRGAGYGELEWRVARRRAIQGKTMQPKSMQLGTISIGAREEVYSGGRSVLSPALAATLRLPHEVKLRASISKGFRIPTYIDLYYSDPTTLGNSSLKPESAWNYEAGADWYPNSRLAAALTVFYSSQRDTIDYTRASSSQRWQATNLSGLRFSGVEGSIDWRAGSNQQFKATWTLLDGAQKALHGLQSEYVFNYPVNNGRVQWTASLRRILMLRTSLGVVQRYQQTPYPVWDASLVHPSGHVHPYVQMTNLTNTGYAEIDGVRMPGRGFVGGLEIALSRNR